MNPIEIREQRGNLIEETQALMSAAHALMRVATGEPDSRLVQAKRIIEYSAARLQGIAMRIG